MRQLMIRAWQIAKTKRVDISIAMKTAWAELKMRKAKWNGKVYGKKEYDSCNVYLNGIKTLISNKYAELLESLELNQAVHYKYDKLNNTKRQSSELVRSKKRADRNGTPYWADETLSECYGY